ncbi:hypothetical protein HYW83_02125 [Candidatus Peregrinibacteria bacterium]|nr:hypothetical protein [Candidatus Peregrinibacteria bacterium]
MAKTRPPQGPPEQPGRPPEQSGEKPKSKKLEIPRAPLEPPKPRERYADVRSRAEAAHRDLDYQERVVAGKIDFREAREQRKKRQEVFKKPRRLGVYIDQDLLREFHERSRVLSRSPKKDQPRLMKEAHKFFMHRLRIRQAEALTELSRQSIPTIDPKFDEAFKRLDDAVPEDYETWTTERRMAIARTIASQYGVGEDPAVVDAVLLDLEKQKSDVDQLSQETMIAAMAQQSGKIDDPEKAFAAAVQSSPELRRQYEEYVAVWKSENVAEIYGQSPPEVQGAKVELLSHEQSIFAVRTIEDDGVTLHIGENNLGEIHFGNIVRDVALYSVDGQPKLFIYDENADKGVVGPVDPKEVRAALGNIMIDTYFSEKFREFSTGNTEQDPTKVVDTSLFKIVHALLPDMQERQEELDARQRQFLDNLARLLVAPDHKYVSMPDKVEFLRRLVADPETQANARKFLTENYIGPPGNAKNMSEFEAAFNSGTSR